MNILYKLVFILLSVVLVSAQVLAQTDVHFETINAPSDVNLFNHFNVKFDIDDGGNFWASFDSSGIYKWDGNNWSMLDISVPNYPQGNVKKPRISLKFTLDRIANRNWNKIV